MYIDDVLKDIRGKLKEKGYSSRKVSVKQQSGGYSYCLRVTIKSFDVDFNYVNTIAKKHESYERDASGDILQGGNTFVRVEYDDDLFSNAEKDFDELANKIKLIESKQNVGVTLAKRDGFSLFYFPETTSLAQLSLVHDDLNKERSFKNRYCANNIYNIRRALVHLIYIDKIFKIEDFSNL